MCKFNLAWRGQCNEDPNEDFCSKHEDIKCCSCGEKATRECSETMGLVCGAPLCDTCEHTVRSNGCNSGGGLPEGVKGHCKPEEQVYKPWYMKSNKEEMIMKKTIKKLKEERKTLMSRVSKIDKAIEAFQDVCEHVDEDGTDVMVNIGHDSHKDYYECKICGKSMSV